MCSGFRNSSRKTSPGCTRQWGLPFLWISSRAICLLMIIRNFCRETVAVVLLKNVHPYTALTISDACYIRQTRVAKQPATPDGADRPDGAEPAQLRGPLCAVRSTTAGAG